MGCFDSTCVISRLAVHHGDDVLFIVLPKNMGTYDLLQEMSEHKENKEEKAALAAPERRVSYLLKKYPRLKDDTPEYVEEFAHFCEHQAKYKLQFQTPFKALAWGTYNDYGWIEENDKKLDDYGKDAVCLFVHKEIALKIAEREKVDPNDLEALFYALVVFAYITRVPLAPIELVGEQYFSKEELDSQQFLLDITQTRLDAMKDYHKQFED